MDSPDPSLLFAHWNAALIASREAYQEHGPRSQAFRDASKIEARAFADFVIAGGTERMTGWTWQAA